MQGPDHEATCASVKSDTGMVQKFFPEYFECYAEWDSTSGLMLLKEAPLPQDILKIGAGGINQIWRDAKVRAAGIKRDRSW
ncbi:MAG: hypothetical protein V8S01_11820 [Dorea sp.]